MKFMQRISVLFIVLILVLGIAQLSFAGADGKKALMIVAKSDFEQKEYKNTRSELDAAGVVCSIASTKVGTLKGNKGKRIQSTMLLKDVDPAEYDAIVIIGGNGIKKVWKNDEAHRIVKQAAAEGQVVAAICAGPGILAYADVLDGKKGTAHPKSGARRVMKSHGCDYQSDSVVVDGNIITANGPNAAIKYGKEIVAALNK